MSSATPGEFVVGGAGQSQARAERAELLERLRRDGILHRSETQPILSGDGRPARWMLDSLSVTLTPRGADLAARCLIELLEGFESRQLATYGLTGVPLMQGCILHGAGHYRGALVRKERKRHGAMKLIEGRLDPSYPVVVVDDSISSGYSMLECARRLEAAGFEVEGGVCLVRFDFDQGPARMLESGYRIAAVFDIWEDFIRHMDGEVPYPLNPTKDGVDRRPTGRVAAEGLHPAELARQAVSEYLATGRALRPPDRLDRSYDAAGGCWVSLRRRADIHDRPARSGHWHLPGEPRGTPAADVVSAAVKTAAELARSHTEPQRVLDDCAIAVTFFSRLEESTVGQLDNDRYGIVVRSVVRPWEMGGALPRMPGIANEWQQFWHAWRNNARLLPLEPYALYRHGMAKVVEPGCGWQPTGVPAPARGLADAPSPGPALAACAHRLVLGAIGNDQRDSEPTPPPVPATVDAVFVTVYANGRITGCAGGPPAHGGWLRDFVVAATRDGRFPDPQPDDRVAVGVSLLSNRLEVGEASPDWIVGPVRFAEQALEVSQDGRRGLLLPFVAVTGDLTPRGYVDEVVEKAGITGPPYRWARYDCATWLSDGVTIAPMVNALPRGEPAADAGAELGRLHDLLLRYVQRHHWPAGPGFRRYDPFADRLSHPLDAPRLAYGAWVKARAGLRDEAAEDVGRLEEAVDEDGWVHLGDAPPSISEVAFLLLALSVLKSSPPVQQTLASRLWAQLDGHGCFGVHRDAGDDHDVFQDYAPGQALLALAVAVETGVVEPRPDILARALRHYRMRFRQNQSWGAVTWLLQSFCKWGDLTGDSRLAPFAFQIADWALAFQSTKTGAFLNAHQPDTPGATTALYLEGLAAACGAAERSGSSDARRATRYRSSIARALSFLDQLVYQERDRVVLPNPACAIGGLRRSVTSGAVYVDYVHHALAGVLTMQGLER